MSSDSSKESPGNQSALRAAPKKSKYGRYVQEITLEEIESVFVLPADEACVKLGICLTVLKRLCRQFGIQRWPYRRIMSTMRSSQKSKSQEGSDQRLTQSYFQQSTSDNNDTSTSDAVVAPIQRRPQRPQRQAALGVRDAIVREKEGNLSNTEEKDSLLTTTTMTTTNVPIAPAIPELSADQLAAQSLTLEESHALDMLMGNFYQSPPASVPFTSTTGAVQPPPPLPPPPPPPFSSSSAFLRNHSDGLVGAALATAASHLTTLVQHDHHHHHHPTTTATTDEVAAPIDGSFSTGPSPTVFKSTIAESQILSSILSSMEGQSSEGHLLTANIAKAVLQLSLALANSCSNQMVPPPPLLPPLFLNQQQQEQQQTTITRQQRGPFGGSVPP